MTEQQVAMWVGVGATLVAALIGAGVAIAIYRLQQPLRRVDFYSYGAERTLSVDRSVMDKVTVSYEGQPVTSLYRAKVVVANSGRDVITDTTITWSVEGPSALLEITTAPNWTGKSAVSHSWKQEAGSISIELRVPFLNPKDDLTLVAHVAGAVASQVFECRLPGLKVRYLDGPYVKDRALVLARNLLRESGLRLLPLTAALLTAIVFANGASPLVEWVSAQLFAFIR